MPGADDPAEVVLIDTRDDHSVRAVDQCRGWNPQQGTMLYWNPDAPNTQFFFNDRDRETGKVFCVLFDISRGKSGERIREYRYDDTPVGNSGIAQKGGHFLAINYARLARLRAVTGYRDARDWTVGVAYPRDDGVFKIDIATGEKTLLVSFEKLAEILKALEPGRAVQPLFINHTLGNREGDRIFFFARAGWDGSKPKINQPFIVHPDGSNLKPLKQHIGGHPEWDLGHRMIGQIGDRQVIYDVDRQLEVGALGNPKIFPKPEGDVALSPDGNWFVNGYKDSKARKNFHAVYRRIDGAFAKSPGLDIGQWTSGDLRQDPGPCWNRDNNQILVPGLADEGKSRQLFVIDIRKK